MRLAKTGAGDVPPINVVVVGAGYAGLRAALGLARDSRVVVTLIDRERRPVVKTKLHELRESASTLAVDRLLDRTNVRFIEGEVTAIDLERQDVQVGTQRVAYDRLVVALGSRTSDFGIPGVREHAIMLDGAADADQLSRAIGRLGQTGGRLVVVGGGPTGVEAAAEASQRLRRGRVTLIDAEDRVLRSFSTAPRTYARAALWWRGVRVETGAQVVCVEPNSVRLRTGESLPYDSLLWSAGVEAYPILSASSLAPPHGRAPVDRFLVSKANPHVYVVGDSAAIDDGAPSAQLAVQQGDFAARDILTRLDGRQRSPYEPSILGQFVSLGCDATGALKVGAAEIPLFGPPARLAKAAGELRHRAVVAARALASS
ncbi:MAG: FAD-dependent oxidoreductase [Myxococcota bacterium]